MLDKEGKNIDACTIGIPDFMHATTALLCMQHGKHVYVEKPASHNPREGELMVEAARWRLGLIYERYDDPASADARAQLRSASLDLSAALGAIRAGDAKSGERLGVWLARSAWSQVVEREESRSLFNAQRLAEAARRE